MVPSPTIPTSFVPKQPVKPGVRYATSGGNPFMMIAVGLLLLSVVAAGGVFGYQRYLEGVRDTKQAEVEAVRKSINAQVVEDFIRTRDRFVAAQTLLDNHVAVSQFFDLLESLTLQSVRFDGLSFKLAEDRSAELQMDGVARSFNALAAESSAFASEKRIKRAIFSDIAVDPTSRTVSFALTADLEPSLLTVSAENAPAPFVVPVATSTPATSTPATSTPPVNPLSL